jgi:hypothetical protein
VMAPEFLNSGRSISWANLEFRRRDMKGDMFTGSEIRFSSGILILRCCGGPVPYLCCEDLKLELSTENIIGRNRRP